MARVLHLYDDRTTPAAAAVLSELRAGRPGDLLARVGGATRADLPPTQAVLRPMWGWRLTAAPEIRRFARRHRIDVIHAWSPSAAEAAAATDVPTLLSVAAAPAARQWSALGAAVAEGAALVATSLPLAGHLAGRLVAATPVEVVAPAFRHHPVDPVEVRRHLGLPADGTVVFAPPQTLDDRGPVWAMWAVGILRTMGFNAHLLAGGPAAALAAVQRFARSSRTDDRLHTIGGTPAWLGWAAADLAVLAGDRGQSATAVAQAVANAVPVIAVDTGETGALIEHERTGWLVAADPPRRRPQALASAILRLAEHRDLAAALAEQAGRTHPQFMDVGGAARRWDALYASAIDTTPAKEPVA
ncbi:MAG: glycosyltransferase family 4 protein [Planctomycetes bacterium]|nr:glycosyltransferase family 4 protein [Planctomycetota bacterium]